MAALSLSRARSLLCRLQDHIQATLLRARKTQARSFARIAGHTQADTIYHIDRLSEEAIAKWLAAHWPARAPVQVVMEGVEDDAPLTFPRGTALEATQWKLILDPIDGTRGLMYDKRSAWILAGLAPQRGAATGLQDILVAAMTELPVAKQSQADQYSAIRGRGTQGQRRDLRTGRRQRLPVRLSTATDFEHGFSSFARFFPAGLTWLAELEETFWRRVHRRRAERGELLIFNDQYISTGGQVAELLSGHDRLIADLRPYAFQALGLGKTLVCHPYDICTALLLTEAGGVIDDGFGRSLNAPLNTTAPIAWVAYANPALAQRAAPVLKRLLRERLRTPRR